MQRCVDSELTATIHTVMKYVQLSRVAGEAKLWLVYRCKMCAAAWQCDATHVQRMLCQPHGNYTAIEFMKVAQGKTFFAWCYVDGSIPTNEPDQR